MLPHAATLEIDTNALRANYRLLKERHAAHALACVVKANAYGLGVEGISKVLWQEGCREFFVATLAEGIELRNLLPDASIGVFNGIFAGEKKDYQQHRLIPVINHLEQAEYTQGMEVILHVDTGITRLGLSESDLKRIAPSVNCVLLMSHLACADELNNPQNAEQLRRFQSARTLLPNARASLCNSAGCFHSSAFHFNVARPGCALYGINPIEGPNPMQPVARLSAPLLQVRTLEHDEMVGYDATYRARKGTRIAIAGLGYADGYFRSLSNCGAAYLNGTQIPIIGIISMDMMAFDVTAIPEQSLIAEARIEFINKQQTVNDIAAQVGTVGYEIFTRIGRRVQRIYDHWS